MDAAIWVAPVSGLIGGLVGSGVTYLTTKRTIEAQNTLARTDFIRRELPERARELVLVGNDIRYHASGVGQRDLDELINRVEQLVSDLGVGFGNEISNAAAHVGAEAVDLAVMLQIGVAGEHDPGDPAVIEQAGFLGQAVNEFTTTTNKYL